MKAGPGRDDGSRGGALVRRRRPPGDPDVAVGLVRWSSEPAIAFVATRSTAVEKRANALSPMHSCRGSGGQTRKRPPGGYALAARSRARATPATMRVRTRRRVWTGRNLPAERGCFTPAAAANTSWPLRCSTGSVRRGHGTRFWRIRGAGSAPARHLHRCERGTPIERSRYCCRRSRPRA
jgi:hypothetical protein